MRLASYWYHAHDAARALPAVLDASVVARRRHAYTEQLRLLERAMELWDTAPEEVRSALRPVDYTEVYPPCGCDPATTALRYLDLMAEAAVAGRLGGERERALKITKRALRLLEDDPDPLRAAWFWVQRSHLVQALARGDGWHELATAQELVRGLPPSEVHAEVLAHVATWRMLHQPGPDAFAAAERAVQYAQMVGAREIELHARLTLGGLMIDAGDPESGFAEMFHVKEDALREGVRGVAGRAFVNLPSALQAVGRSRESVPLLREGIAFTREFGLRDAEAWVWGNLSDSLYAIGQWDEAADAAAKALQAGHGAKPQGSGALRLAHLALARGDLADAARHLATADARRRRGGQNPRRPRRTVQGTGDRIPARHLPLRLAPAAGRRHRRGRRPRAARLRGGPRRGTRPPARDRREARHRRAFVGSVRAVDPCRAEPGRGHGHHGHLVGGGHRLRVPGPPLRPRPRPVPPGAGPARSRSRGPGRHHRRW